MTDTTQARLNEMVRDIANDLANPPTVARDAYGDYIPVEDGEVADDGLRYYIDEDDAWRCHDPESGQNPDEDDYPDTQPMDALAYLEDALDIEWTVSNDGETLLGANICVATGGPAIWINTRTDTVEGYWWGTRATASYTDTMGLFDAMEELWRCR